MVAPLVAGAIAAVGVATSIFGGMEEADAASAAAAAEKKDAKKQEQLTKKTNKQYAKQAESKSRAARRAADIQSATAEEINSLRDSIVGDLNSIRQDMVDAQNQQVQASIDAESARFQQMTLDSMRDRRQWIREAIKTRGLAASGAVNSGAGLDSSGSISGMADVGTQARRGVLAIAQNLLVGNAIFAANEAYALAGGIVNQLQSQYETRKSLGEAEIANITNTAQADLAQTQARYEDSIARSQKKVYALADKSAASTTQKNIATGAAKEDALVGSAISGVGDKLFSLGVGLF